MGRAPQRDEFEVRFIVTKDTRRGVFGIAKCASDNSDPYKRRRTLSRRDQAPHQGARRTNVRMAHNESGTAVAFTGLYVGIPDNLPLSDMRGMRAANAWTDD